jgi:hypothetical protein
VVAEDREPAFAGDNEWSRTLREQARTAGLDPAGSMLVSLCVWS